MIKRLACLALALVLALGTAVGLATKPMTMQEVVGQVIVPMALENDKGETGYNRHFSHEELAEIIRVLGENGITLPENNMVMHYLTSGYGCSESLITQELGFEVFGEWGTWTTEQLAWYDELEYRMGHAEVPDSNVPGKDNMTREEAVAYALKKLREKYGEDLDLENRDLWRMHTWFSKANEAQGIPEDCWGISWEPNDLDHLRYIVIFNDRHPEERTEVYYDPLLTEDRPLTTYYLDNVFSRVYGNHDKWTQKVWQKYHAWLLDVELDPDDYSYINYVGYQLTIYPEPEEEDISREEAIRIAKEAMTNKRAAYNDAVLTEYEGERTWLVSFAIDVPFNQPDTVDEESGYYAVSIDSRTGEVRSLRSDRSYDTGLCYIAEGAYRKTRDSLPKEEDLIPAAAEAVRKKYPEAGDPLDKDNYSIFTFLRGKVYVSFKTRNVQHSNITVSFTPEGKAENVRMDPPTDGDNLYSRYYQFYGPMGSWKQIVWVLLERDMKDLEPKEIEGKVLKATHYPEEDTVSIKHEEARELARKTTGKQFTEINSCVLVDAKPHPVWIVQLLSGGVLSLAGIDAETGETVFTMPYRADFSSQYMVYSLPETWRKIEMEEKGPAYMAQAAIIERVFPADMDWRDCTVGNGITWKEYLEMEDGTNWRLEVNGLTVRYTGRREGVRSYEVELDRDGNVIRFEEKD